MQTDSRIAAAQSRMVQIMHWFDEEEESARLQAAAIGGVLLGGWVSAFLLSVGFRPIGATTVITVGAAIGLLLRSMD